MLHDEAIALLRSGPHGVTKWNEWMRSIRIENQLGDLKRPSISSSKLDGADLRGTDLSHANFSMTGLMGANLSNTKLIGANFVWANLGSADLSGADLTKADLASAYLESANLTGAQLDGANLGCVNLDGADLTDATSCFTNWSGMDLSTVKGLESIRHMGPSSVGVDTLFKSHGKIPECFLHGCGVPESLISYLPSLLGSMQPIQFYSCVLSHSSQDKEFARRLHSRMQQEKLRVWFDEKDMPWGKKLHPSLNEAVMLHDKLLLVLSEHSMNSDWVKTEIYYAHQKERKEGKTVLFPIRLCDFQAIRDWRYPDADTGKDLAREIREYYIPGDFENWKNHDAFEAAFAKLMTGLRTSDSV